MLVEGQATILEITIARMSAKRAIMRIQSRPLMQTLRRRIWLVLESDCFKPALIFLFYVMLNVRCRSAC